MKDLELIKKKDFYYYKGHKEFRALVCIENDIFSTGRKLMAKLKHGGFAYQAITSGDFPFHFGDTRLHYLLSRIPLNGSTQSGLLIDDAGVHRLLHMLQELISCFRTILPIMSDLYKYYPKYGGVYFDPNLELRYLDFGLEILPCIEEILPFFKDNFSHFVYIGTQEYHYDDLKLNYVFPTEKGEPGSEKLLVKRLALTIISNEDYTNLLCHYISQRPQLKQGILEIVVSMGLLEKSKIEDNLFDISKEIGMIGFFEYLSSRYSLSVLNLLCTNGICALTETDKVWQEAGDQADVEERQNLVEDLVKYGKPSRKG